MTLTAAEHQQRVQAARAPRHRSETSPSVHQGSSGPPSRAAIGLFRQGQARPDTRSRRGPWDTRTTEAPVGAINATFKLHFPKALRSAAPVIGPPLKGRPALAEALARRKDGGHQDVVITNPATVVEAHRHPLMKDIIDKSIGVIRDHQKGTIERGHQKGLIPEGARPGTVARAYKHAALLSLHRAGLGDYDFHMDAAAKKEFAPLEGFMRYAHRRVFDQANIANKGRFQPFKDEFGEDLHQKKRGKLTGTVKRRMRPMNEFIKLELGDLSEEAMEKSWTNATGVIRAHGSPTDDPRLAHNAARFGKTLGGQSTNEHKLLGRIAKERTGDENGRDTRSDKRVKPRATARNRAQGIMEVARVAHARAQAAHGPHGATLARLGMLKPMPELPHGDPPLAGPDVHIKHAAMAVEDHFEVPKIGTLHKLDMGFSLSDPDLSMNPATQLRRAMHPRLRRRRFTLRLNTQRGLRRVLSGGITRQERWQLGATTKLPDSFYKLEKRLLTEADVRAAAASTAHPTMAQARAGNYRMGHTSVGGLGVTIETPKGRHRRGIGAGGKFWSVKMPAHYGYIKRTEGADGDHVDVYLGPHAHRAEHHRVYIVDQQHAETKRFDEHKAMLGFRDREHATGTYDAGFSDGRGPDRRRAVHEVTFADFKHWIGNGDTTKPYKAALKKGVIADAMQFGAAYLPKLGRAATQMTGTSGRAAGMLGRSRAGQFGARVGRRVAANPGVQRVASHPRVAPALSEARGLGPKGFIAPLHAAGRIAGAAAAGERGAKIGGNMGLAADYAPVAYTAASAGQALMAGHRQKNDLPPARTLTQQIEDKALGKRLLTGLIASGARGVARHIAGVSTRQKFLYGAAGGSAAAELSGATDNHPGRGAAAGATLGGVGAAILSRGRAIGGVTRSARSIYTTGMKDAVREHLRVLAGAKGSPHHIAQATSVFRANQAHLIRQSRAKYAAGMAGARAKKGTIAAGALGGAAIGASTVGRSRWKDQPLAGE